jgi:hypothetical protein
MSGYFQMFANPALLAFSTAFRGRWRFFRFRLCQFTLLLPSARCTPELYIFVGAYSPVSIDGRDIRFLFCFRRLVNIEQDSCYDRRLEERGRRGRWVCQQVGFGRQTT